MHLCHQEGEQGLPMMHSTRPDGEQPGRKRAPPASRQHARGELAVISHCTQQLAPVLWALGHVARGSGSKTVSPSNEDGMKH